MSSPVGRVSLGSAAAAPATPPTHGPRADKVRHAASEFESLLVKQLLKSAKLGGSGSDEKTSGYADMAVDALASAVERGGGLGLARRIEEALSSGHAAGPLKVR